MNYKMNIELRDWKLRFQYYIDVHVYIYIKDLKLFDGIFAFYNECTQQGSYLKMYHEQNTHRTTFLLPVVVVHSFTILKGTAKRI